MILEIPHHIILSVNKHKKEMLTVKKVYERIWKYDTHNNLRYKTVELVHVDLIGTYVNMSRYHNPSRIILRKELRLNQI